MRQVFWVCLLVVLIGGCKTTDTAHRTASSVQAKALAARSLSASKTTEVPGKIKLTAAQAGESQSDELSSTSGIQSLSLNQSISRALESNPDLIAVRQAENVGSAALSVAQTYPFNPSVQVQATPYQDAKAGGPGTTYHYVLLMQTIQLAHQQQFREEGATSALNSVRWNIHQQELLNVAQTERLYFTVLYQRGLLDLAQASHQNNEQLLKTLQKQLDAGQATAADVAIVRVDASSTSHQLKLAKATYETALRDLKRQLGMLPADRISLADSLEELPWDVPHFNGNADTGPAHADAELEANIQSWTASRPDVMAAHADIDTARAAMCLASANRTPDLQLGPYYQRTADGTTFLGFRTQMDIPVINNGRPLEQQRIAELNQRASAWQQLQVRAELEGKAAWERYRLALDSINDDQAGPTDAVPNELQSLEQQFLGGEIDITRVIQARTSIIQNQRVRLDLLNELAQSAANLTAATGIPYENLIHDRSLNQEH